MFVNRDVTDEATVVVRVERTAATADAVTAPAALIAVSMLDTSFQGGAARVRRGRVSPRASRPRRVGLLVDGVEISEDQEQNVQEALAAVSPSLSFYVERGYQASDETMIALLVLGALGGLLVLGGTLTATFLSLSDARPDLATLSAVGASPRTRRAVAASYAVVIGVVGAVLGAGVGFIPGIAVSRPLTSTSYDGRTQAASRATSWTCRG